VTVGASPQKSRKGRIALIAGSVVVALTLTGVGVLALTNGWFDRGAAGGAASPEAAAVSVLESAVKLDGADVLATVAPSERAVIGDLVDASEALSLLPSDAQSAVDGAKDALKITLPNTPTFETEELATGVTKATVTGGSIRIEGDPDRLADNIIDVLEASGASDYQTDDDARDEIRDTIAEQLPFETNLAGLASMMDLDNGLFLVAVEEDGKWYVSASMTAAQYAAEAAGLTSDQLGDPIPADEMKTFATPEDAVTGLYDAINDAASTGDLRELAKALPPAESRLLAVYGPAMSDAGSGGSGEPLLDLSDLSVSTLQTDGDHAYVALDSFTTSLGYDTTLEYRRDGQKFTIEVTEGRDVISFVLDGSDSKRWTLTGSDSENDGNSFDASLAIPGKGQIEVEYTASSEDDYGDETSGSFSFDGNCIEFSSDYGDSERTCDLADSVKGTGLDTITELPDLSRLLSVTTLKSGDSWYASPSATVFGTFAALAGTIER
jgi:hypothetical protein